MKHLLKQDVDKQKFIDNLFNELSKLPFGSLPKTELELVILHSIIVAQGGYKELNRITPNLQSSLKLTQTKFKNKVLQAQIRYSKEVYSAEEHLKEMLLKKDISELNVENDNLILIISNPLLLDNIKTFFDSNEIINDTSFNKSIIKINIKGLLTVLAKILEKNQVKKIESKLKKEDKLENISFSLIDNIKIDSLFKVSLDPLSSVSSLLTLVRSALG